MKQSVVLMSMGSLFAQVLGMAVLSGAGIDRAHAESPVMAQGDSAAVDSIDAEQFIKKAAMGGMAEVELGRLAQRKAASEAVRAFGETMVDDHTKANQELRPIASEHGVEMPQRLDETHMQAKQRLEQLEGAEFDRAYMQQMVEDHRKTVALFEKGQYVEPPDVRMFAEKTLPTLRRHLERAQELADDADDR